MNRSANANNSNKKMILNRMDIKQYSCNFRRSIDNFKGSRNGLTIRNLTVAAERIIYIGSRLYKISDNKENEQEFEFCSQMLMNRLKDEYGQPRDLSTSDVEKVVFHGRMMSRLLSKSAHVMNPKVLLISRKDAEHYDIKPQNHHFSRWFRRI